jgi:hypothetical protein
MTYTKEYYQKNKEKIDKINRAWYYKNKQRVLDERKADRLARPEFYKEKKRKDYQKHKEKRNIKCREWGQTRKEEIKKILGDKCIKCGFDDKRALTIHHKEVKTKTRRLDYIVKGYDLSKVELICANCHAIEHYKFYKTNNKKYD